MTAITQETHTHLPRLNYAAAAPEVLQAMLDISARLERTGLEKSLIKLVEIRASQINGCAFCLDMHIREARELGESEERLDLLSAWQEADVYTQRERAALRWTEEVTLLASKNVSNDAFGEAHQEFTDKELAGLTLAIVVINGWNRFNVAFRIPPRFAG